MRQVRMLSLLALAPLMAFAATAKYQTTPTSKQILSASQAGEWRALDPNNTLYMQLPQGRVIIELAPQWAPAHAKNIKTLVHEHYFDGTSVYRVADNFVAQWGDPDGDNPKLAKSMGTATSTLPPEYTRKVGKHFAFTRLPDGDVYAPEVGFVDGLPMAYNPKTGEAWLASCYAMVGVARDVDPRSGNGNTLYVSIGQAPRQLDHQLAVVGRVVQGMPWLSALPRGPEPLGVYTDPGKRTVIASIRLAADVPEQNRSHLQTLRSDSKSFARLIEAKRNRVGAFYREPAGAIDLCNVPLPVRAATPGVAN